MTIETFDFLTGKPVEQIWVWGPIRLVFELGGSTEPEAYVDVLTATLNTVDGREIELNAFERQAQAGAVLQLLHQAVVSARTEEGVLHLVFENGENLRSQPDDSYESWTVVGDGREFQCLPGGEVGSW